MLAFDAGMPYLVCQIHAPIHTNSHAKTHTAMYVEDTRNERGHRHVRREFFGWHEFTEFISQDSDIPDGYRGSRYELDPNTKNPWSGTHTWEEALAQARNGWREGVEHIIPLRERIKDVASPNMLWIDRKTDVLGNRVNVGAYFQGRPDCFQRDVWTEQEGDGREPVIIAINVAVSASISKDVIIRRGAAVAALVEVLEMHGRPVELYVTHAIKYDNHRYEAVIHLKAQGEHLDSDIAAFALISPAMLRRAIFSANELENNPEEFGFVEWDNYGVPAEMPEEDQARYDIYLGRAHARETQWSNVESTTKWVEEHLAKLGVEFS